MAKGSDIERENSGGTEVPNFDSLMNMESRVLESRISRLENMLEGQQETLKRIIMLFLLYIIALAVVVGRILFGVI